MTEQSQQGGGGNKVHITLGTKSINLDYKQWEDFLSTLNQPQVRSQFENGPANAMSCYRQITELTPVSA